MSNRFDGLRRELDLLRRLFLPDPFHPLGMYPDGKRVQAHTRAFLVLGHAEIETFLEDWAKDLARTVEKVWTKTKRVTAPLAFLLSSMGDRMKIVETLSAAGGKDCHQRLEDLVRNLLPEYFRRVNANNGVKEKNVLSLFEPLGVPSSAFGTTQLPNLETLGSLRGTHAHTSAGAVVSVLDPETEYHRIQAIAPKDNALHNPEVGRPNSQELTKQRRPVLGACRRTSA